MINDAIKRILLILLFVIWFYPVAYATKIIAYLPLWVSWELDDMQDYEIDELKIAFFSIDKSYKLMQGDDSAESSFEETIQKIKDLKQRYPNTKISIAVGGGNVSDDIFSRMAQSKKKRLIFISSIIDTLKETGFDGISLDWEYPRSKKDRASLTALVQELREALTVLTTTTKKNYLLSYSIPNHRWIIGFIDISSTLPFVDYIELMSYDFVGNWSEKTGNNANLRLEEGDTWSTENGVNYFKSMGIPLNKMALGIPFYGIEFSGVRKNGDGLYNTILYSKARYLSYYSVVTYYLQNEKYKQYTSTKNSVYLFNKQEGKFVSYLDENNIIDISNYIKQNSMYGAMVWHLWQDDYNATLFSSLSQHISR